MQQMEALNALKKIFYTLFFVVQNSGYALLRTYLVRKHLDLLQHLFSVLHVSRPIHLHGDLLNLVKDGQIQRVEVVELGGRFAGRDDRVGEVQGAFAALGPVVADDRTVSAVLLGEIFHQVQLCFCVVSRIKWKVLFKMRWFRDVKG